MLHLLQLQSVFLLTNLSQMYLSQGWSLWQQQGLGSLMPGVSTASWPPHNHWRATSVPGYLVYIYWISSGVVRLWPLLSLAPFTSPLLLLWLLLLVPGPTTAHHTTATAADTGSRRYKYCTYVVSLFCTHNAGVGCDKMPSRCNVNCTIITIQSTCHIGF